MRMIPIRTAEILPLSEGAGELGVAPVPPGLLVDSGFFSADSSLFSTVALHRSEVSQMLLAFR